ncbi:MAG: FAD-binding oxidoreductase [Woeseiaceae bacterium]|nr:FAD-binding oxidoreductase [Woeseiaceae bacterium]
MLYLMMLIDKLKKIVGQDGLTQDKSELEPRLTDWRGVVRGEAYAVVFPACSKEVSLVVQACAEVGVSIVPQGGNTGMCAGSVPDNSGEQVIISLARMSAIRAVDAANFSMEVEAGCILENIQNEASAVNLHFPLSLGAEGSCQIGGNLSTNAGGINVLRYGTARAQVLGLEVVLADGTIVNSLRSLQKDTAGYDLKQLFIGSEGTLGIITAATLRLYPQPGEKTTALVALKEAGDAVNLLGQLRTVLADKIEAFELVSGYAFELLEKHIPDSRLPFTEKESWYVLIDVAIEDDKVRLERALMDALEIGLICNAVVAKNSTEAEKLWRMRHSIAEAERAEGKSLKHDISVPGSRMQEFLQRGDQLLSSISPDARLIVFGHVGDDNLHYNVTVPNESKEGELVTGAIYDLVDELGGSFSAEHGVGQLKRHYLLKYRSTAEISLMRTLKAALDPENILNPGKVI